MFFFCTQIVDQLRQNFVAGKTWSYDFRMQQLKGLRKMLTDHRQDFIQAVHLDVHKPKAEGKNSTILLMNS